MARKPNPSSEQSKINMATEIGSTGLKRTGGYVIEEFLPALSGMRANKVFREMSDNDPIVGAMLFAITTLFRQVKWSAQAVDDSIAATEAASFLDSIIDDLSTPWSEVIAEACSMFPFGFAPMEIVWKRRNGRDLSAARSKYDDGLWGVAKLAIRAQDTIQRWEFDEAGELVGFWQQTTEKPNVFIPMQRCVLFRTTTAKGNPEGRSALRNAYRPWVFKKRIEEIEGIGIERDLAGLPVVRVPGSLMRTDASAGDKQVLAAYRQVAKDVRRDASEGILLPSDRDDKGNFLYDLNLLSAPGQRQFDTSKIIDRYDRRIASTVLADFILLGQQAVGSFALSSDKTELFSTALGGFLDLMADTLERQLVERIWEVNGLPFELMPKLTHSDVEKPDLTQLSQFLSSMASAGMPLFPDRDLENQLREAASLPPAPEEGTEDMFGDKPPGGNKPAGADGEPEGQDEESGGKGES